MNLLSAILRSLLLRSPSNSSSNSSSSSSSIKAPRHTHRPRATQTPYCSTGFSRSGSALPVRSSGFSPSGLPLISLLLLTSCSSSHLPSFLRGSADEAVVYALGPREGYTSPLNGSLKPACPALLFDNASFRLTPAHQQALQALAKEMAENKKARLLVAGYTPPSLPQDHARSLSERRALAVRQRLIELGLEAANIQTVGFGNDFSPTGPSSDVVVIYRQN